MGLFDLPSPFLSLIDGWLGNFLPAWVRLLLWAALGAFVSMELYRLASPQKRIAGIKVALRQAQERVSGFDGEFEDAWPHIRRMLSLAFRRVALVFPATILASLPLLFVILWLDSHYGNMFPPENEPVEVAVADGYEGRWIDNGGSAPHAEILNREGTPVAEVPVENPVPVIHKRQWWNLLIGNPAGYLDDQLPFDRIDIALPRQEVLPFGPEWLRGWEILFLGSMMLFALLLKRVRGIA